uniref:hypothetical protein n=1 Tax=Microzonia abyssicola TaxID=217214 RepID=UPI002E7A7372|nr:hypothetical protein V2497_pgp040 [Syringoderma abyssicola]WAM65049.1 hypothetical protein [Syringoderma abyssicola]
MQTIDLTQIKGFRFDTMPEELIFPTNIMRFNTTSPMLDEYTSIEGVLYTTDHPDYAQFEDILKIYDKYNRKSIVAKRAKERLKLNKIKVYVIVREKKEKRQDDNSNKPLVYLPINNYENLSNHPVSRTILHRDAIFQTMSDESVYHGIIERKPGNRCRVLVDLLSTQAPFGGFLEDVELEDLTPQDDSADGKKLRYDKSVDKAQVIADNQDDKVGFIDFGEVQVIADNQDDEDDEVGSIDFDDEDLKEIYRFKRLFNLTAETFLVDIDSEPDDGSSLMWMEEYGIPRQEYEYDESDADNALFTNPQKYFTETDNLKNKNIIPVFASLEEAENLLSTALEDLLFPYIKKKESITEINKDSKIYEAKNIDYLDDAPMFMNRVLPVTEREIRINSLAEKRRIKSITEITNHYDNYYDKKEVHISHAANLVLKHLLNTKIIEIGLGDFFDSCDENKTGELIFIPSAKKFKKPFIKGNPKSINLSKFNKYRKKHKKEYQKLQRPTANKEFSYSFEVKKWVDIIIDED